jgi:hypothetical protein
MSNAGIREPGNLDFVLASIGAPAERRVLFDEYFHGARATLVESMWQSPARWMALQLAVVALGVVWTYARRSGPVVPARHETRLAPLEFVRTLGSLYQRAGAAAVPVEDASRRVRFALTRRLGLLPDATVETIVQTAAVRWPDQVESLQKTLRESEEASTAGNLSADSALVLVRSLDDLVRTLQLFPTARR